MPKLNRVEAIERLENASRESLAEWACDSHKDFYGIKGRHMIGWSREQLVDWIKEHFFWDTDNQCWSNIIPFHDYGYYEQYV